MSLQARYRTLCMNCDEWIMPADWMRNDGKGWTHVVCPDRLPAIQRTVCPVCFTEVSVSGTCMCEESA